MIAITNDSSHSTIAVGANKPSYTVPIDETESSYTEGELRLSFNEDANEYFDDAARSSFEWDSEEEKEACWYSKADYQQFRSELRHKIHSHIEEQRNGQGNNQDFYVAVRNLYLTCRRVDYILEDASALINKRNRHFRTQQDLAQIFVGCEDLIGMEHQIILSIKEDLYKQRDAVQDVVYDVQCEYNRGMWSLNDMMTEMQESCLNHSQSGSLFYQLLAKAQQAAQ